MNKIHMTYHKDVPKVVMDRWCVLNPAYTCELSLDDDCISFLHTKFNTAVAHKFNIIKKGMFKADLWRLCKLYHEGGVYSDVDIVPYIKLDTLNPSIFYTCLAVDRKSIFQAFMVNMGPKSPLLLCFLISFLVNSPVDILNGPTYDIANCLMHMLNAPLLPNILYTVKEPKVRISIPPSDINFKTIDLVYFPKDVPYTIKLAPHSTPAVFTFSINGNTLVAVRTDCFCGWQTTYAVDICFDSRQQIYLFEEVNALSMQYCYVKDNHKKILDSRDVKYYSNKGW